MILFILEGKDDKKLFSTIQRLFFDKPADHIVCTFNNNIYALYRKMVGLGDGDGDIVLAAKEDNPELQSYCSDDFSEVYLFFDYDFQDKTRPLAELNEIVASMLKFFDNETENGKLYVNYPMLEAIRFVKALPDPAYYKYTVSRSDCRNFKNLTHCFSCFKGMDFIQLKNSPSVEKIKEIRSNWELLKEMNAKKANFICNGANDFPKKLGDIEQKDIFVGQLQKYVKDDKVSVLSSYPLFLLEYFGLAGKSFS